MVSPTNFGLAQIGQIALPVRDLARAEQFYAQQLGMQHLFTMSGLAFFDCQGMRLMLSVPEDGQLDRVGSVIYFTVPNIHAAYQTLLDRGVHFDDTPHLIAQMETYDLWMAFFRDSEANVLAITGEVARP